MPVPVGWDVDRAAQLYRDGWSLRQLGVEFGVSAGSIRVQLVKRGVSMRPAVLPLGRPDVSTEEVIRLRDVEHLTWAAIGQALAAPEQTVFARYRRTKARRSQAPRPQPWRQVLLAALEQSPVIEVATVIEEHLGRRPTRAEAIAARRAATTLASNGRAVRTYAKRDTRRGARLHLMLGRC